MAEENDTLKLTSVNYTSDNYLAAKKNEDGSYNVENKVVFEEDITVSGSEVATKSDLDGKQDQLTSENAGDNITITGEGSTLKINATGGGGELKAKTWLCGFAGSVGADCSFGYLNTYEQPGVEAYRTYTDNPGSSKTKAIIKFTEEKSLTEVNKWLLFEAKLSMYGDNIIGNDDTFIYYTPFAVCPWKSDNTDEWPESN